MNLNRKEYLRIFYEENRKISQELNGHPRVEKTHIQTREKENHDLELTEKKLALVRGGH